MVLCCISSPFGELSTTRGKIIYVLLTRAPLYRGRSPFSCDLHVLGAPLTFVLSQNQTLQFEFFGERQFPKKPSAAMMLAIVSFARYALRRSVRGPRDFSRVLGLSFQGPRGAGAPCSGSRYLVPFASAVQKFFSGTFDLLSVRYSDWKKVAESALFEPPGVSFRGSVRAEPGCLAAAADRRR